MTVHGQGSEISPQDCTYDHIYNKLDRDRQRSRPDFDPMQPNVAACRECNEMRGRMDASFARRLKTQR